MTIKNEGLQLKNKMDIPNQKVTRQVSPQWDWLMREMAAEQVSFGEARVIFHNGEPVEIVELLRKKRYNEISK